MPKKALLGLPARTLADALLRHYDAGHRRLPWRGARDPYRVWVSEILLQQTQVATVVPYFRRFVRAFPTARRLARAPRDRVLKLWEGLGYYARARNLHAAARRIVAEHGGRVPRDRDALVALPGIGRYTAGAIRSIAYGLPEPVVDGNVERVLSRVFAAKPGPEGAAAHRRRLWDLAGTLVPRHRPGDFNQALMELGATVCAPRAPGCARCPLRRFCRAYRLGRPEDFPERLAKGAPPARDGVAAVLERNGRVLVVRRPAAGLLGGLWEVPWVYRRPGETDAAAARRAARERAGMAVRAGAALPPIRQTFSHCRLTLTPIRCEAAGQRPRGRDATSWLPVRGPSPRAVHATMRKVLDGLGAMRTSNPNDSRASGR